jgi:hypothetical protein
MGWAYTPGPPLPVVREKLWMGGGQRPASLSHTHINQNCISVLTLLSLDKVLIESSSETLANSGPWERV